ncbi:flagellar basal-body MS-ring/collar protein FliF [Congregibacter litoralis]|uniref:Flagellar M-ring protein n=1 Tax=Congregibacter litoralis KT71 TaxID=314285 RepID=A4A5Z6_9GAMM|nr:flagellar basal-body MS-ring/collar protein FliF [Congregibacter litoralis]EAQ98443.1 flagellar basal-body M-ring protein/flagellar hook-basal body protein (fliF) [Congregibacter litoralis KT71]
MAEAIDNNLFNRFSGFSRQPATRQLALLIGLAASIALAMGMVQWVVEPNYKPLYGTMAPEDTNDVIASLEANGMDYRMDQRTGMVAVPAGEVHRARLLLAGDGYPRGEGVGFESLYREQEIGLSSFMEQARFHRALESELARTISALDNVRGARVHLAMAKQSAFLRQREQPAASVMLNLYAGRTLNDRQLAGIIHLVASSVPNLESEQVSVVDQQGKLLSQQGRDDEFAFTQDQFQYTRQLESNLSARIVDILEPILGANAVRAQVAADVDFTRVERTEETYAPDTRVRSEQTSEETSNQPYGGGVPGTLSNEPPIDTTVTAQQAQPNLGANAGVNTGVNVDATAQLGAIPPARTSRRSTVNYEMDKTISHVRETPGTLQKLSIAVVLDYIESTADDGTTTREPMPQERIDEVTSLVREAVGFDAARGDTVSVISASFVEAPAIEDAVIESSILEEDWIWQLGKGLLALIVLLSLIFVVVRPLVKFAAVPVPMMQSPQGIQGPDGQAVAALGGAGMSDDQVTLGGQNQAGLPGTSGDGGAGGYQQQLQMARSVAAGEPDRAAQVVRNWVSDDG